MKLISLCILLSVCACFGKPERPNMVWLVSEDNSASWLKLYNENGASMPTVEKLAKNPKELTNRRLDYLIK